jgi:hypothetical protein
MNRKLSKLMKAMSHVRDIESDDILGRLGLTRKRSTFERVLSAIGLVSAGIIVGAGVGLLASPVAPAEVRKKIGDGVRSMKNEFNELVAHETSGKNTAKPSQHREVKNGAVAS